MISKVFVVIAVSILVMAIAPINADNTGNICGYVGGAIGSNPWAGAGSNGWANIFHATVTYVDGNDATNSEATKSWGTFWQLTSIVSGQFAFYSAYSNPTTGVQYVPSSPIQNLAAIGVDFASNAVYNSSKATSAVDGNGITFELVNAIELPGQYPTYATEEVNFWFASGYFHTANVGVINQTNTAFMSDLPGANLVGTGGKYAATTSIGDLPSCVSAFAAQGFNVPTPVPTVTQPAFNSMKTLTFTISDQKTYQVSASITAKVVAPQQIDSFGVSYVTVSIVPNTGTRTYGFGTPSNGYSTSTVVDPIAPSTCTLTNLNLYANPSQYPFLDSNGLSFSLGAQLGSTVAGAPFDGQMEAPGVTNSTSWQVYTFYSSGVVEENNIFNRAFPALPQTITLA
jgi:hypothetical protein